LELAISTADDTARQLQAQQRSEQQEARVEWDVRRARRSLFSKLLRELRRILRQLRDALWPGAGDVDELELRPITSGLGYVEEVFGHEHVERLSQLFLLVERYAGSPANFDDSSDCRTLADRLRKLACERAVDRPDASIVIPVYNRLYLTLTCIASILETQSGGRTFEILVGDDASSDATLDLISSLGGCVRVIRHDHNRGFLENCNAASRHARGDHIVLLNNDTFVLPGWLEELLSPLDRDARVGLVGSKLVNSDGTLQEAGGILWRDGSGANFGRGQDPRLPEFNYQKEVDYVSGASMALRTGEWERLGGFDRAFAPAYCEDSDLAFRVRAAGMKVVYAPRSEVFHHEGGSHGRDEGSGIKAFQVANTKKLFSRWRSELEEAHCKVADGVFEARDRSRDHPHMLVIDYYIPQWDRDAGSRTMLMYLQASCEMGFQVTYWPASLLYDPEYAPRLQELGIEVLYGAAYRRFGAWFAPRASKTKFVLLSRPEVAHSILPRLKRYPDVRRLYYGHDLHFERMRGEARARGSGELASEAASMEVKERSIWRRVDLVLYPSNEETERVRELEPLASARTLQPYGFEPVGGGRDPPRDPVLIFVAGFGHPPNIDAAIWLVEQVLPLVRREAPGATLSLVGSNPTDEIRALAGNGIEVTGRVSESSLDERYRAARVAVAPLRFGAGVKLKVVEAMNLGTPLVTTSVGAQGLPGLAEVAGVHDDPDEFAKACVRLLQDDAAWRRQSASQADYVRNHFSVAALRRSLSDAIAAAEAAGPRGRS